MDHPSRRVMNTHSSAPAATRAARLLATAAKISTAGIVVSASRASPTPSDSPSSALEVSQGEVVQEYNGSSPEQVQTANAAAGGPEHLQTKPLYYTSGTLKGREAYDHMLYSDTDEFFANNERQNIDYTRSGPRLPHGSYGNSAFANTWLTSTSPISYLQGLWHRTLYAGAGTSNAKHGDNEESCGPEELATTSLASKSPVKANFGVVTKSPSGELLRKQDVMEDPFYTLAEACMREGKESFACKKMYGYKKDGDVFEDAAQVL
ncbi:unnamed protein product [Amoebophrya sp. A120]|nr:unnamed protein product [Amoebophrya sp. A120]|eukprot:GSA120T00015978001.1